MTLLDRQVLDPRRIGDNLELQRMIGVECCKEISTLIVAENIKITDDDLEMFKTMAKRPQEVVVLWLWAA